MDVFVIDMKMIICDRSKFQFVFTSCH